MPNFQNSKSRISNKIFVDFVPAELRKNKDWIIVYYCKHPINQTLDRFRLRVPKHASVTERLKLAKKMVSVINSNLEKGWSPFFNEPGRSFKTWKDATTDFLKYLEKQLREDVLRYDTVRSYKSNLNILNQFLDQDPEINVMFAIQFNTSVCVKYLDWIYMVRNNLPRTRNNHLIFLKMFCTYLVNRGILPENPAAGITNLKKTAKKRVVFPDELKPKIEAEVKGFDNGFYCLCMMTYYCMIRNTEARKIQVSAINLKQKTIFFSKEISKNRKDETVTIPNGFYEIIARHIENAKPDDYLFSSVTMLPGSQQMAVRTINNNWEIVRGNLKLENKYQFYGFKDTGITDLFKAGVPAIIIRDQARHSDIRITELYAVRSDECNQTILSVNSLFNLEL